jgi:hypothetical protein
MIVTHAYTFMGNYAVTLNVTDSEGAWNTTSKTITVRMTGIHDIGVLDVKIAKTLVGQGFTCKINTTIQNQGDYTETFNVTAYANTTVIGTLTANNMLNGTSTVLTFTWNTTGLAKGNYTIWAYAWPVPGETDMSDNTFTGGTVRVAMPGDIEEPFGIVDMTDIGWIALAYGSGLGDPRWNPTRT